jgi:hypothetical protein
MLSANNLTNKNAPYVLTKSDILLNVSQESPRAAELLAEYGLHCLNCFFNEFDTLEMGAQVHGMSHEEVNDMITEINTQLEKEFAEQNKTQ